MKLLWVCNQIPGPVQLELTGKAGSALWVDRVLAGVRDKGIPLHILCRGGTARGQLDDRCSYALFPEVLPQQYSDQVEAQFLRELQQFQPNVIHIWGTEYSHTLAMVNAAERAGMLDKTVISIQGLCSMISLHYCEGIPEKVLHSYTLRDFLRRDNILGQQRVFAQRGLLECQALRKVAHIIGRTPWDRACTRRINPAVQYHFCNETLREEFYRHTWTYEDCQKHRIFASSCAYPIKGFHYLLEAFAQVVKIYPDATLAVPGKDFRVRNTLKKRLRDGSYERYLRRLVREYRLEDKVEILGGLSAGKMREQYLRANVFVLPSTVENSPNSLGEAMLLGVPCVAADVGGVSTMMLHEREGFLYQSTAPYMLADYIQQIFSMEQEAESMGRAAALHACRTHDPDENLNALLAVYSNIAESGKED